MVQTTTIFSNVSKGILAKHEDLQKVFGTTDEDKICRIILAEGELQAGAVPGLATHCAVDPTHFVTVTCSFLRPAGVGQGAQAAL